MVHQFQDPKALGKCSVFLTRCPPPFHFLLSPRLGLPSYGCEKCPRGGATLVLSNPRPSPRSKTTLPSKPREVMGTPLATSRNRATRGHGSRQGVPKGSGLPPRSQWCPERGGVQASLSLVEELRRWVRDDLRHQSAPVDAETLVWSRKCVYCRFLMRSLAVAVGPEWHLAFEE